MSLIKYTVQIMDNSTGKIEDYNTEIESWEHDDTGFSAIDFMWGGGNYSCDCNRELFFYEALGVELTEEEKDDTKCGSTRYSCRAVIDSTGEVVFDEFNEKKTK